MIDVDTVISRFTDDHLHSIDNSLALDPDTPRIQLDGEDTHKVLSAIVELVLYLTDELLTEEDLALGRCECLAAIGPATLEQGYCSQCMRPIGLAIGEVPLERI